MYVIFCPLSLSSYPPRCPPPPLTFADPDAVKQAAKALTEAKRPLVVIGKGKYNYYTITVSRLLFTTMDTHCIDNGSLVGREL